MKYMIIFILYILGVIYMTGRYGAGSINAKLYLLISAVIMLIFSLDIKISNLFKGERSGRKKRNHNRRRKKRAHVI